jgi:hypothetical protein
MAIGLKSELTLPEPLKTKIDPGERSKALKAISDHRKAVAWQIHRWPLDKKTVQEKTKIHLPRSYLAAAGEEVETVWPGDDLNQIVHHHYFQNLDDENEALPTNSANFVTPDSITVRRCVCGESSCTEDRLCNGL